MASDDGKPTVVDRPPSSDADGGERHRAHDTERGHTIDPPEAANRRSRRSVPPGVRYDVGGEIGRGGMGRVVEATDVLLDRRVAMKEALTNDPELLRRFARETKITARLEHPAIVPVYDAGTRHGQPYYVMRRVSGRPLSELIRDATTLDARLALVPHVLGAAQAIAHAHQRGIIHRDIKPSNILVGELGETVVIDWGLAKVIGEVDDDGVFEDEPDANTSLRTKLGVVFGTPGFMAPDQVRGEAADVQSDVYSLGASLYNLLAAVPPHYANDSTQMMRLAAAGPARPIEDVVPGVPPELSTIVDAAMAYAPAERYHDAGAFAEELKRFLAGQLVAAHAYTRTERFVRFLRHHRAAVAIGGIALVVVAVFGAFAVSQIIGERDRADAQARLATQGRHEAETARATADERADLLLLSRARALVETNPTAALASLKQLSPTSTRLPEARAIATAARMRGVAWAMQGSQVMTSYATLDQTALRLAAMGGDGTLRVYDLDARREAFAVEVGRGSQPRWILDGKAILVGGREGTRLFDAAGKEIPTSLPRVTSIQTDERGLRAVIIDAEGGASRLDLATHALTPLMGDATEIAISADGEHTAVVTSKEIVVLDSSNRPLLRRPKTAEISRVVFARHTVALIDAATIYEARLARDAKWEVRKPLNGAAVQPYWLDYNNDRLYATYTDTRVFANYRGSMLDVGRMEATSGEMQAFANDYLVVGGDGRRIYYVDGSKLHELYLPIALRFGRLLGRRAHARLVAIGDGAIVVLDLDTLPRLLPVDRYQSTLFMNDRTLVSTNVYAFDYSWYDIPTNKLTKVTTEGPVTLLSYDRKQGRLLAIEGGAPVKRGLVYEINRPQPVQSISAAFEHIQLLGDGGVAYSNKNRLYGGFPSPSPSPNPTATASPTPNTHTSPTASPNTSRPELFSTDGDISIIVRLPETRFAVVAEHELVRGDLRTSNIERLPLADGPVVAYAVGYLGALVLARGNTLYRWDAATNSSTLAEITKLEAEVAFMIPLQHGLLIQLENHATIFLSPDNTVRRLAATRGTTLASEDRVIVPGQFQYDVIELPSFARWGLPITRSADNANVQLDISPNGAQLIEKAQDGRIWVWKLPVTDDLATALDATNLFEDANGLLLWPWQSPDPTK